jgi:two-component system, cell cycle sensor histidine kinase and response regulator CckA
MSTTEQPTILVIDDDEDYTQALSKRLDSSGFRCISALSGEQGLAAFQTAKIDLVLSDLNMPSGDGVELAESIRKASNVPIIFVTGFRDEFKRRLRHIPNVTTLQKPFESQYLIDLVSVALWERTA